MSSRQPRASNRWFRRLIRLFPFEFRSEFEPEMVAVFDDERRAARTPRLQRRLWVRAIVDTLRAAPREHLDVVRQDFRFAVRVLRRGPAFTFAAIITLALGIGANTAVFSLVRAVLLRPLPYEQPDRLVSVSKGRFRTGVPTPARGILTGDEVLAFRAGATMIGDIAVVNIYSDELSSPVDLLLPDVAERLRGGLVTSNFFDTLGVHAAMGRLFGTTDSDGEPLAVLSDGHWRSRFGADPNVIGRTIDLALIGRREPTPRRFTIVGVLPPRFRFTYPRETEIWAMLPWSAVKPTGALEYEVVARLKPGATAAGAQAELTEIGRRVYRGSSEVALATPLPELASADARPGVLLLVAVAAVVLLIACINVILLLLGRMAERGSELAVRTALGAGFVRIGRQLLMETGVLVGVGGTLGVALAFALQPVFRALVPAAVTRGDELTVDVSVLAFAAALCGLLTLVCGLAPLWHMSTRALHDRLKQGAWQASASRGIAMWRRGIVSIQVAVVLVLLVSATLLLHSFWRLQHVDLGYDGADVLTMQVRSYVPATWTPGWLQRFQRDLLERVRAVPGVIDVGMSTSVPMRGVDFVMPTGRVGGPGIGARMRSIDARYFDVMRIPVIAGRAFTEHDTADSPRVAVVSQSFARQAFGDRNPLGERLDLEKKPEIVGVVGDVRHQNVKDAAAPAYYLPRSQQPNSLMCLVVRTQRDLTTTAAEIRAVIHALAPTQPVERITTLDGIVADTTSGERFYAVTTVAFGGIALLLAVAGLIGVVRRGVAERTRELAVRTALGADPGALVGLILTQELRPVAEGAILGLVCAFWLSKLLRGFLFEVSPLDPWAYVLASALLVMAAVVGAYFPARRVTRIDPATALRAE